MKSAGIITFMQTNYGAVLQAYATQKFLSNKGVETEIIDFTTKSHLKAYRVFQSLGCKNPLKRLAIYCLTLPHANGIKMRFIRTEEFKKNFYKRTRRYRDVSHLMENPPIKDIYVSGSDQVFNPKKEYIPIYFLGFAPENSQKVAYAPSFGITNFDKLDNDLIKHYLSQFDALSCREKEGAEYIETLTAKPVPVVLDPVFLLEREQWIDIAKSPDFDRDFIFVYDLGGGASLIKLAQNIRKELQLPIYCLTCNRLANYKVDKLIFDSGPSEFLGLLSSAKYIVTDSFHGTAFSIIFNKPFNTFIANKSTSSRISNMLSCFRQTDRIVEDADIFSIDTTSDFRYEKNIEVINSRNFLNTTINARN